MFKRLIPLMLLVAVTACANPEPVPATEKSCHCCEKCECCKDGMCKLHKDKHHKEKKQCTKHKK